MKIDINSFSEIIQAVLIGMLMNGKIHGDFFGRYWFVSFFTMTSWWRHHRDPAEDCYSEAPTDLASAYLNRRTAQRLSPTYWKAEIRKAETDGIFKKMGNFVKFWSDPPLFSNILKSFIRKEPNLLWHMEKYQSQSLTECILAGLASLHRFPSGRFWPHP